MATKFEVLLSAKLDENSVKDIQKQLDSISKGTTLKINADSSSVNKLRNSLNEVGNAANNAQKNAQGLDDIVGKFASWQVVGDVIHGVKNAMEDMVQQVFDLDESLVELEKVSDLSGNALQNLADDAFNVGEKIGATGKDVIDATTIFAQAGYEAKDALDLGEQAIMLQNVSEAGATAAGSAQTLIAAMKAFNLESTQSNHIVDALNEVSNKYAVSVNDLSTAIQKSSASMAAGNNTLEQTFGLVTAGTEILQEPGRVANGLGTITARLTAKNDDYIKSITKGQGVLDAQTGELRSTYDILHDLSDAWEGLTSVEQQELAETVAGKTQRSLFTAIMTNFDSAVGATEAALNSEGSAAEENAKRMDSLKGKVIQLQSAWQSFARDTIDSNFIKNILTAITGLINFTDKIGGLPVVLTAATSALMLFKGGLILDKVFKAFSGGLSLIKNGLVTLITALPNALTAFRAFSVGIISAGTAIEAAVPLLSVIALAITGVVAGINAFTKAQKEATEAAIQSSQEAANNIDKKNKEKKSTEEQIEKLKQEKQAYIDNARAKGENADNSEFVKSKDEEIKKRQENIDKIEEENKKQLEQREAAARSMKANKADGTGLGWNQIYGASTTEAANTLRDNIKSINKELKEADGNTGAYKRKLEELRGEYEKQAQEKEKNGQTAEVEIETIKALNKELDHNSKKYEEDKNVAEEFYDILKSGGEISNENIEWLKNFYNLSDEQISKLREGIEVKTEDSETTDSQTEAQEALNQKIEEAIDAADNWNNKLQDNIDQMINYGDNMDILKTAQEELANSGAITAETFKEITDNNLLEYLDNVNGTLQVNTDAFVNSTSKIKENALANLEATTYEQIRAVVLEDLKSKEDDAGIAALNAADNLSAAGSSAQEMGAKMLAASGDVATLTNQLNALNKAQGGTGEVSTDVTNKVKGILDQASKTKAFIESWKPSTSKGATKSSGSRKKSRGSKKSTSSTKEEYKAEIDLLYGYKNALDNAKDSVDRYKDALKNTENFKEQEKYLRKLIDATNNQINKTNELKNAQIGQINDYINQLRAQGFAIDYNNSTNELYINNMQHLADFSGDTAKNLEKLIKKIQDLNDDNRSLDGSVRDLTDDVKDYYDQLADIPEKKLKKFKELMEDFQQSRLDQVENQIQDIEHDLKNDERLKALQDQIDALEKQKEELEDQETIEEKLLAVEEAKIKLANAQKQKTLQVYREGQGFVWEADPDAIADAAEELADAQKDLNDQVLQDQIDNLQAEYDAIEKSYQDRIDALQDFLDEQNYIIDKSNREGIQSFEDLQAALRKYGLDSAEYLGQATDWLNNYNNALSNLDTTVNGILANSSVATDGLIYSSNMQDRINQALSTLVPSASPIAGLTLSNIDYDRLKGSDNQTVYVNSIELPNVQNVDDFVAALKDLPRMATTQVTKRT